MADDREPERSKRVTWDNPRAAAREARHLSGADFFDKMRRGKLPEPPFGKLLGIDLFDAGDGHFRMSLQPHEVHYWAGPLSIPAFADRLSGREGSV